MDGNAKDDHDRTALMMASKDGNEEVVRILLEAGRVDVNANDSQGRTALIEASLNGAQEVVGILLKDNRLDVVNANDDDGVTALIAASRRGKQEVFSIFLKDDRADVNVKDLRGRSAFFWANYRRSPDTICMFLRHGRVDVNFTGGALGNRALTRACFRGQATIVWELLAFPIVDVNRMSTLTLRVTARSTHNDPLYRQCCFVKTCGGVSLSPERALGHKTPGSVNERGRRCIFDMVRVTRLRQKCRRQCYRNIK